MHERVSKSSAWTPTSIQKKSKSLHAKPSTSIQPKQENISSQQQEMPTYSTAGADLLAANIMRSLEPKEPESSETSTGKPQSESEQAAFPSIAAQIPSTPVVQSQEIGIQRQCSECAKEQSTEEGKDIDEISAAASGIQTKLTIGAPPNPYQQAANQMAEVMSKPILYAPMPQVQRFSPEESQIQRRAASAQSISPMMQMSMEQQAQMSALIQRTFRGEGTQTSFEPVQAKLTVGEPGDKYEQEADAVAQTVVEKINAPTTEPSVQRQSEVGGASELNITVMRQSESGVGEGASVTQDVEQGIQKAKGGGQTLDESVREPMEQAFGADFSGVKVHADSNADMLNRSIAARAFTTGQDIFFKQGEYDPRSRGGQELLAHELTHVVQQTGAGGRVATSIQKVDDPKQAVAQVRSLHIEENLKQAVKGNEDTLKSKVNGRTKAIKKMLEQMLKEAEKYKGQKWFDEKLKALKQDQEKELDTIVSSADSTFVSKALRDDILKAKKSLDQARKNLEKDEKQWHQYDDKFASQEVVKTLAQKGFSAADLKALIAQESGDLTIINDREGDIAGIAQMGSKEAKEVGGKAEDRLVPEKAIPLAAKVLIKKAQQLEAQLVEVPQGEDYKKFVFASYNAGATTIARAQKKAKEMKRNHKSWEQLINENEKSPLYQGIKIALPQLNTNKKYKETTEYVSRIFKRLH